MSNFLRKFFLYEDKSKPYYFSIPNSNDESGNTFNQPIVNDLPNKLVSKNLKENIDYLTVKYNSLINSDIIFREFVIHFNGQNYNALLLCIDGMINSNLVNDFLLKPLMKLSTKPTNIKLKNSVQIKKTPKLSLEDFLYSKLIPQNSIRKEKDFESVISLVNLGNCALFIDSLDVSFLIDVKGYQSRNIDTPKNEVVVRGSQEAFVEKLRDNTSMLRRLVNNENLVIENTTVGTISKTLVSICYMQNIANDSLVNEVKYRINNLRIDYIISSGQLEQLIQDNSKIAFPQMIATERPDKAANHLLEGRVVVLVNGSPYSLIMPGIFVDFLASPEDLNLKHQYSNLLKIIRIIAAVITLLLPRFIYCNINLPRGVNSNRITVYHCCCQKLCTISGYN